MPVLADASLLRRRLAAGVEKLADAVAPTLGPTGKTAVLQKGTRPIIVDDGAIIARQIILPDRIENMGAQIVKEAAFAALDETGDGTTTTIILARAAVREGMRMAARGLDAMQICQALDALSKETIENMRRMSLPVSGPEDIARIASISSGSQELGALLADAMDAVGKDGMLVVQESQSRDTRLEISQGARFDKGYLSPYFINDKRTLECNLQKPFVLICAGRLSKHEKLMPVLKHVASTKGQLLLVCDGLEGSALSVLIANSVGKGLVSCAVSAPGFGKDKGASLEDMACLVGATVISRDRGIDLDSQGVECLGRADKATINKNSCVIIGGAGEAAALKERIGGLKTLYKQAHTEYERESLGGRISRLDGRVAIVHVGADTETEMKRKKAKLEDAAHAVRSAMEEGYVVGGGLAFLAHDFGKADFPGSILRAPARQICANMGRHFDINAGMIYGQGFDAIDPLKVCRVAFEKAMSAAKNILGAEAAVVSLK